MSVVCGMNRVMNLATWSQRNGVARVTAYRWFGSGTLPVPARRHQAAGSAEADVQRRPAEDLPAASHRGDSDDTCGSCRVQGLDSAAVFDVCSLGGLDDRGAESTA